MTPRPTGLASLLPACLGALLVLLAWRPAGAAADVGAADKSIDFEDCRISAGPGFPGIKARCGILLRPLDPDDPRSPLIDLNVAVVPALSLEPAADPFVPIAGGPGQSTIEFYAAYAGAFEKIRRSRDIVLLDQRGTGQSSPLQCPEQDDVTTDIDAAAIVAATRECLSGLPYDPRFFTTSVAVTDLEALRVALGYPQLDVYGVSYGTRVAQHYLRHYPQATRSVILDGVVPPALYLGPDIALQAQHALDVVFDRCAADEKCNDRFPGLRQTFQALYERLARAEDVALPQPRTGQPASVHFGQEELAGAVRLLSYNASTIALLPLLIQSAADGDLGPIAAQYLMASDALSDALSFGMHNAIMCTEDVPFVDDASVDRGSLEHTYLGVDMLDSMRTMCSVWPRGRLDDDLHAPLASSVPVLLMSGEADPITPPAYAEEAAARLDNARLITAPGQGHGQAAVGCVPGIMAGFVERASTADLDSDCLQRVTAMPFFLDFTGPAP